MTIRQHETISIDPAGVLGVVLKVVVPKYFGNICHAHRGSGMTAVSALYRIHTQGSYSVGEVSTRGHRQLLQMRQDKPAIVAQTALPVNQYHLNQGIKPLQKDPY